MIIQISLQFGWNAGVGGFVENVDGGHYREIIDISRGIFGAAVINDIGNGVSNAAIFMRRRRSVPVVGRQM